MRIISLTLILVAVLILPAFADNTVCTSAPDAKRIVDEITACREYETVAEEDIEALKAQRGLMAERIDAVSGERDEARKLYDEQKKAGEQAVQAATPSWWQRARSAGGWMGIGAIVAAVAILLL